MNNSRLRNFSWIPSCAIGECSEIPRSKWSILSIFSKSNRTWQNRFFERFRCSNIYVLPMKKWRLKNIVWFHKNAEKHDVFPNTLGLFVFYDEKYWKSVPAAKGGWGANKFSAEIMGNRATWQIVGVFAFCIKHLGSSVVPACVLGKGFLLPLPDP